MSTIGISRRRVLGTLALAQTLLVSWPAGVNAQEAEATSRAYEPDRGSAVPFNGSKAFDAIAVRPTTFLASLVSAGVFVVSLPFTAFDPAIGVTKARENLVDYPFNDTFKRPLGDLDAMGNPSGDPYPK